MKSVVDVAQKGTKFLGFKRGYNVICFIVFAGALLGFSLSQLQDLSFNGVLCKPLSLRGAPPGECYWYKQHLYKVGLFLHIGCVLPAAILATFQFIPSIRHRFLIFHRLNGYLIILLFLISNAGAMIISRHAMGGAITTQTLVGILFIMTTFGILNAYYNIKRLQLDQHRAWMLRTFAWSGAIISLRLIVRATMQAISSLPSGYTYYDVWSCEELSSIAGAKSVHKLYPECNDVGNSSSPTSGHVILRATLHSSNPFEKVAVAGISFPVAMLLAILIHAVGIELYLTLTPREAQRLRQISYERQLEHNFKNPGSAGLVPEKIGDADPWVPMNQDQRFERRESSKTLSGDVDGGSVNVEKSVTTAVVLDNAEM